LTAVVLKVTWFNTLPEDGTGVLKDVKVAILWLYLTQVMNRVGKRGVVVTQGGNE
jgi:hypothetical protein